MDLREKFKKEKGYGVMAVRQDYAGQRPYEDGFCDEYVEWLEAKVKNLSLCAVSESNPPIEVETMAEKVFTLANELAINGYGNAAVKMHSIHNGMITKDHYYSR